MRIIGEVIGCEIRLEELSQEEAREEMIRQGWGDVVAGWLLDGDAQAVDHPQTPVRTVEKITGRPATTFAQWVARHAADFR